MPKLNDTQSVLLATAAQRDTQSLYPLPDTLRPGARVTKAVAALLRAGLAIEREATDPASIHRTDGDLSYGVFATEAGLSAIGIEPADDAGASEPVPATDAPRQTKAALLLALVSRDEGATLAELIAATGWLPHTTRAALTGLRKKGHAVLRGKRDDQTCYTISAAA